MVAVLDAFTSQAPEMGVAELADRLGLPKSTVHRFLVNLEAGGLLERVPRSGRFRLGLRLLELGGVVIGQMSLLEEAPPVLHELSGAPAEDAYLAILEGGSALYLEAPAPGGPMVPLDERRAAHACALGKILLAWRPGGGSPAPPDGGLDALTSHTLTDPAHLRCELETVRMRGVAVDDGEARAGLRGVAAPVRDHSGQVIAALGVEGPADRLTPERLGELTPRVQLAARTLSRRLGAHRARDLAPRPRRVVAVAARTGTPVASAGSRYRHAPPRRPPGAD
jgi:DNA-binding IclR family transcriptional regulator